MSKKKEVKEKREIKIKSIGAKISTDLFEECEICLKNLRLRSMNELVTRALILFLSPYNPHVNSNRCRNGEAHETQETDT